MGAQQSSQQGVMGVTTPMNGRVVFNPSTGSVEVTSKVGNAVSSVFGKPTRDQLQQYIELVNTYQQLGRAQQPDVYPAEGGIVVTEEPTHDMVIQSQGLPAVRALKIGDFQAVVYTDKGGNSKLIFADPPGKYADRFDFSKNGIVVFKGTTTGMKQAAISEGTKQAAISEKIMSPSQCAAMRDPANIRDMNERLKKDAAACGMTGELILKEGPYTGAPAPAPAVYGTSTYAPMGAEGTEGGHPAWVMIVAVVAIIASIMIATKKM